MSCIEDRDFAHAIADHAYILRVNYSRSNEKPISSRTLMLMTVGLRSKAGLTLSFSSSSLALVILCIYTPYHLLSRLLSRYLLTPIVTVLDSSGLY